MSNCPSWDQACINAAARDSSISYQEENEGPEVAKMFMALGLVQGIWATLYYRDSAGLNKALDWSTNANSARSAAAVNGWMWGLGGLLGLAANFGGVLADQYAMMGMVLAYVGSAVWLVSALAWAYYANDANSIDNDFYRWWGSYALVGGFSQYYAVDELDDLTEWADMQAAMDGKAGGSDYSCCPSWNPTCTC